MKIEYPSDYQYSQSDLAINMLKIPKSKGFNLSQKLKKQRKQGLKTQKYFSSKSKYQNYFQEMYKQAKKKMYINLFIRKLKQTTILTNSIQHQLSENINNSNYHSIKTYQFNNNLQILYTFVQIFFIFIISICSSLIIVFPCLNQQKVIKTFTIITIFYCLINIFISICIKSSIDIINENQNIMYKKDVIKKLNDFWIWLDFLLIFIYILDIFIQNEGISKCKIIIVIKLINIFKKITNLQILLISNCFREQFWQLIKTFLYNFIYAHFLAIILLLMTNNTTQNWLTHKNIQNSIWYQQYIWSYYWATTTMLTVGFGDICPTNSRQALVMIFIETLSCVVLAYNVNSVGKIIKKITSYQQQKVSNLKIFTQMQKKQNVSQDIKKKITNYITQSAQLKRNFNVQQQKQMLDKLPKSFYQQFKKQSNINIFSSIPFFRNLTFERLRQIALKIDKKLTHPQQIILQSGSIPGVCIVNNGHIILSMNRFGLSSHGRKIQQIIISPQQYKILSLYFFINKPINYDIRCKDYAIVYTLSGKELQNILSANPSSYQYYCMAKDKDRFNPNDWEVQKCQLCQNRSHHTLNQCPKLHYVPIKWIVISKMLHKNPIKMKNMLQQPYRYNRIQLPSVNALKINQQVQKACKIFQQYDNLSIKGHLQKNKKRQGIINSTNYKKLKQNSKLSTSSRGSSIIQYQNQSNNQNNINNSHHNNININNQCVDTYKIKLYQEDYGKFSQNSYNIQHVFKEVGEKLRDQLMKTQILIAKGYQDDIQSDIAHDYTSYFHTFNPSVLGKRKNKCKNTEKQIINISNIV